MPTANANPFLEEIEAEKHDFLLREGNLHGKKQPPRPDWNDEKSWRSKSYTARISRLTCACGSRTDTLLGVFHEEETPSGARRSQALDLSRFQVSLNGENPVILLLSSTKVCPACISSKGFQEFSK